MTSKRIEDLAADFWEFTRAGTTFPRNLEQVLWTKSVTCVRLNRLSPSGAARWTRERGIKFPLATRERWLNGLLIVYLGRSFLFVEASLSADESQMVVAHEFAHYLAEYDEPRNRILRRLGPSLLPVLDGERPPTDRERIEATLAGVRLGGHVHYMERTAGGSYVEPVEVVEQTANELALELIAPWRAVGGTLQAKGLLKGSNNEWVQLLQHGFGLPRSWALPYAQRLRQMIRNRRSFSEALGL